MQKDGEMSVYGGSWRKGAGSESDEQRRQLQGLQETENEYTAEKKVIDRGEGMMGIGETSKWEEEKEKQRHGAGSPVVKFIWILSTIHVYTAFKLTGSISFIRRDRYGTKYWM